MKSTWKKYLLYSIYIIVGGGLLYGLLQIILTGYSAPWTGFGERTLSNGDVVGEKTLWDWMELLIIPLVLALGAFFLNRSERALERETAERRAELEREIAKDRQQEASLQAYLDRMANLLLDRNLQTTNIKEVRNLARVHTLSVLRVLDPTRKGIAVLFLIEAGLILSNYRYRQDETVINLQGADLRCIDLSSELASDANLSSANLSMANFQRTVFDGCDFSNSNLTYANLQGCDLVGDIGPGLPSNIINTDLSFANLANALVTPEQLAQVKSLKGATMPDGTIHE